VVEIGEIPVPAVMIENQHKIFQVTLTASCFAIKNDLEGHKW